MAVHAGGCICGAVRYETTGEPRRVGICHCRWCQRATGGAYMVEPLFPAAALRITRGEPRVHNHRSEGSGKLVRIQFCAACGTKLYLTFERFEDTVGIYAGTYDDPAWFGMGPETTRQIFTATARPDTWLHAGVPSFPAHSLGLDGTLREAVSYPEPVRAGGCENA